MFPVNGSLHMAPLFPRSGPGESGSPMSQVLLRCYDFPSRLSGRLFASLSVVHAILLGSCLAACAPGRPEGPSGPGSLSTRRPELPVSSHVTLAAEPINALRFVSAHPAMVLTHQGPPLGTVVRCWFGGALRRGVSLMRREKA